MHFFEAWGIPICKIIVKESRTRLKQVSKSEFAWLYENFFRKMKDKCWTKTCVGKKNSKRGKYYVPDKWYYIVKKQNIV